MQHGSLFFAMAGLLGVGAACLLDTNDDSGTETGSVTSGSGTSSASSSGTDTGTGQASTAADETAAGGGVCGWGPTGDEAVPEGYVCGGDGEDPSGTFAMPCPEGVDLQVGGVCGGIKGEGCCDTQGNAWFCGDAGAGPVLALLVC